MGGFFVREQVPAAGGGVAGEGGVGAVLDGAGGLPEDFEEEGVRGGVLMFGFCWAFWFHFG